MSFKQLHWLEIGEYAAIALTFVSLLMAIATKLLLLPLIFLSIALVLNTMNRLRLQYLTRRRISRAIDRFQQELLDIAENQNIAASVTAADEIDTQAIPPLQDKFVTLEEALNNVIQYLNKSALAERVEDLEKSYAQLKKEILAGGDVFDNPQSPSIVSAPTLPPVDLTETDSPILLQAWNYLYTLDCGSEAIAALDISSDGKFLASVGWDRALTIWEMATGKAIDTVIAHDRGILAVLFTDDGEISESYGLATSSFDQTIRLWSFFPDASSPFTLNQTLSAHIGSIHALAYCPQSRILVSGSYDRTIKQWNLDTGKLLHSSYDDLGTIYAIALDRDREIVASAGGDGRISLWKLGTGENLGLLVGNVSSVEALAISPDGQTLAAGCVDGTIKLWQLEPSSQPIAILSAHAGQVNTLKFGGDGQILCSGGADGLVKIWHPSSSKPLAVLKVESESSDRSSSPISSLSLSEGDRWLAAGTTNGTIEIWQQG